MGIGKVINALGNYNFYNRDYKVFSQKIAEIFDANILISFVDYETNLPKRGNEFIDFNKKLQHNLEVHDDGEITYQLSFKIESTFKNELIIDFTPYQIFYLQYLPFHATWFFFMEDLKQIKTKSSNEIWRINNVRNIYKEIMKKLSAKKVLIFSDIHQDIEEKYFWEIEKPTEIEDVIKNLSPEYRICNFEEIMNLKDVVDIFNDNRSVIIVDEIQ